MSEQVEEKKKRRRLTDAEHEERAKAKLAQIAQRRRDRLKGFLNVAAMNLRAASDAATTMGMNTSHIDNIHRSVEKIASES